MVLATAPNTPGPRACRNVSSVLIESREAAKEPCGNDSFERVPAAMARATSAGSCAVMAARKTPTRMPGHTLGAEQQEQRQGRARHRPDKRLLLAGQGNRVAETGRRETHHGRRRDRGQT